MPRTETISRDMKCKIHRYVSDIEEIPGPTEEPRRWSEIFDYSQSTAGTAAVSIGVKLRDAGLLEIAEDGRYRATKKLAEYMREKHDVDIGRPTFGLTTVSDRTPAPASQSGSVGQTPNHQSTIEEYTDSPDNEDSGLRKEEG